MLAALSMIASSCSSLNKLAQYFTSTFLPTVLITMLNLLEVIIRFWWEKTDSTTAFWIGLLCRMCQLLGVTCQGQTKIATVIKSRGVIVVHLTYHNFKCCNAYVPIADSLDIQERKLIYCFQNWSYLLQNLIIPI